MDPIAAFASLKTPRRILAISTFLAALYLFRHLALLLVFFVMFERALGASSRLLARRLDATKNRCVMLVLLVVCAAVGIVSWLGIGKTVRLYGTMHSSFPDRLAELRDNPLILKLEEQFGGTERIVETARHYAGSAVSAASAIGHFFVYVLIGFILAVVYTLEEEEITTFWRKVDPRSLTGTIGRWFGHLADATIVTVQLQLIVAVFNTVTTLPVLLLLRVPNVPSLMLLVFTTAFVPVVGNVASGVILSLLAYKAQGWLGVGVFTALTFVLHKIESYYLSPRVTARHVKIPGFLLIVSLLLCEHLFGFVGLFLSFPILFIGGRIRAEFLAEDTGGEGAPIVLNDKIDQIPTSLRASEPTGIELGE